MYLPELDASCVLDMCMCALNLALLRAVDCALQQPLVLLCIYTTVVYSSECLKTLNTCLVTSCPVEH